MSECEESSVLDKLFPVNFNDELLRNRGGSGCFYRRFWGHGLWPWAFSLGYQFLLCESCRACEDVISQNMLAEMLRRFGIVLTGTHIAFPDQILHTAV